ncbi:MAG TPA: MFS transporter [Gaiellaceae bacterium]|nr:MFS transporter [Gaiellaceae bacterium]
MRLSRNRDFVLFQAGQLLSTAGSSLSTIAYPLLVLAVTGSPAQAGVVSFARLVPSPLLAMLAGVLSDRLDRRRIMLTSDAVRALAMAMLALVVWQTNLFWPIPLLAFVEGAGDAFFFACAGGVLRSVVPPAMLPSAVSVQQGRVAVVGIVGPPAGGALFAVARALPFGVDALSYAFSFGAISAMRTPFQQPREPRPLRIRADLAEGFRFLWTQPFLRATTFFYAVGNFTIPAFLFVVLVDARRRGLTGGEIGILLALFSVCILVGSLLGGRARRRLSVRAVVMLEAYSGLLAALFLIEPNVYLLLAALLPQAFVLPITDSYVVAHRLAATPDRLLGRAEAARLTIARTAAPLGSLAAGVLLSAFSTRIAVAVFLALTLGEAIYATAATALASPPPLEEAA